MSTRGVAAETSSDKLYLSSIDLSQRGGDRAISIFYCVLAYCYRVTDKERHRKYEIYFMSTKGVAEKNGVASHSTLSQNNLIINFNSLCYNRL